MRVAVETGLGAGPEHLPGGRRRLDPGRGRALHLRHRRRARLRVRARHQHAHRRRRVLLLHQAADDAAGQTPVLQQRRTASPGSRRETLGIDELPAPRAARPEGGPDGQDEQARQRPLRGRCLDRLRRAASGSGTPSPRSISLVAQSAGLYFKGLNFGIEFEGGVEYSVSLPAGPGHPGQRRQDPRRPSPRPASTQASSPDREHLGPVDPGADRAADQRRGRRGDRGDRRGRGRRRRGRHLHPGDRRQLGRAGRRARPAGPGRLPDPRRAVHLGLLPRVEDVRGRPRGAGPRRRDHHRRLRPRPASRSPRRPSPACSRSSGSRSTTPSSSSTR